jgi:hypothetical protein
VPKAYDSWRVLPHKPIEKLTENLWRVQGRLEGMAINRVMTIARLSDGRLVIHNAMALHDDEMQEIEAFGEPAYLIVPNGYHRLDARVFHERYPNMRVVCPSGSRKKVEQVVPVDMDIDAWPSDEAVRLEYVDGIGKMEGVMIVRSEDGVSLVFNDVLFNIPQHGDGVGGFIFRYITQSTGGPRVSRVLRWFVVKDQAALRRCFERLADTPELRRVIVSHHAMITLDPAAALRRVADTL